MKTVTREFNFQVAIVFFDAFEKFASGFDDQRAVLRWPIACDRKHDCQYRTHDCQRRFRSAGLVGSSHGRDGWNCRQVVGWLFPNTDVCRTVLGHVRLNTGLSAQAMGDRIRIIGAFRRASTVQLLHELGKPIRDVLISFLQWNWVRRGHLAKRIHDRVTAERWLAGRHVVNDAAKTE